MNNKDLAIGIFDGLHHGHIKILANLKNSPSVITFNPHPRKELKLIYDIETRIKLLHNFGIGNVKIVKENDHFYNLSTEDFIKKEILAKGFKNVYIGSDARFGKNRQSSASDFLNIAKEFNINVNIVEPFLYKGKKLSSTYIRDEIKIGNVGEVSKLLNYCYFTNGVVQVGTKTAEKLGYKTANLYLEDKILLPCYGVYKTHTIYDGILYKSISYIGKSPTLLNNKSIALETHIFGFDKIIYDENISVIFDDKIRGEMIFDNKNHLLKQIKIDINYAKK